MIINDIPAVPRFLMREADHHVLQAMATDDTSRPVADPNSPDNQDGAVAPSPASNDLGETGKVEGFAIPDASALPRLDLSSAPRFKSGYSIEDLALFRVLTGYRLDTRTAIWRAVDMDGNRVPVADRLFTTLAEEAFRFADRQRRSGGQAHRDLTIEDLMLTLTSLRQAANTIGSRGLIAFERLEAAIVGFHAQMRKEAPPVS